MEEICTKLPGQFEFMNPNRSKPHSGVVVKVTRRDQFTGEIVEDLDLRLPTQNFLRRPPRPGVHLGEISLISRPNLRSHL